MRRNNAGVKTMLRTNSIMQGASLMLWYDLHYYSPSIVTKAANKSHNIKDNKPFFLVIAFQTSFLLVANLLYE